MQDKGKLILPLDVRVICIRKEGMEGCRLLRLFTKQGGTGGMLGERDEESHESGWGTLGCFRS